jgi:hypothetical protein
MLNCGLIVIINKFNNKYENYNKTIECSSLDDTKNKLIKYLSDELSCLNIDYPLDLESFDYLWFNNEYIKANSFDYYVFIDNKWIQPWTLSEIYLDVYDKMLENENNNPPNFEELYSEPIIEDDE